MMLFYTIRRACGFLLALGYVGCAQAQRPIQTALEPSLVGEWIITEQSAAPLQIATLCQDIRPGATITFRSATLTVHAAAEKPCAVLSYKVQGQFISFLQQDMVWVAIYELTAERLVIRSPNLFTPPAAKQVADATAPTGPTSEIQVTLARK